MGPLEPSGPGTPGGLRVGALSAYTPMARSSQTVSAEIRTGGTEGLTRTEEQRRLTLSASLMSLFARSGTDGDPADIAGGTAAGRREPAQALQRPDGHMGTTKGMSNWLSRVHSLQRRPDYSIPTEGLWMRPWWLSQMKQSN